MMYLNMEDLDELFGFDRSKATLCASPIIRLKDYEDVVLHNIVDVTFDICLAHEKQEIEILDRRLDRLMAIHEDIMREITPYLN